VRQSLIDGRHLGSPRHDNVANPAIGEYYPQSGPFPIVLCELRINCRERSRPMSGLFRFDALLMLTDK
jgi:hypothetical protein